MDCPETTEPARTLRSRQALGRGEVATLVAASAAHWVKPTFSHFGTRAMPSAPMLAAFSRTPMSIGRW